MTDLPFNVLPPMDVPQALALKGFRGVLRDARLMTVAVGSPAGVHVNTAYFASAADCGRLWFLSEVDTAHAMLIGEGTGGAVNIYCQPRMWGGPIRGVQAWVRITPLLKKTQAAAQAYMRRFPRSKKYLSGGLVDDFSKSAYFECQILRAKVIDQALFKDEIYMTLEAAPSDASEA